MTAISSPAEFETLFRKIWTVDVKERYEKGVLNSERALQACIVGALVKGAPDLVVLVEPTLYSAAGSGRKMIPDLWIGDRDTGRALAVIELKYIFKKYPEWMRDIEKLAKVFDGEYHARTIVPATGREVGGVKIAVCNEIDHETLAVFAVVGKDDAEAMDTRVLNQALPDNKNLAPRFLHAWGRISRNAEKWEFGVTGFGVEPPARG
jgi:hypothetical protein